MQGSEDGRFPEILNAVPTKGGKGREETQEKIAREVQHPEHRSLEAQGKRAQHLGKKNPR